MEDKRAATFFDLVDSLCTPFEWALMTALTLGLLLPYYGSAVDWFCSSAAPRAFELWQSFTWGG